MSDAPGQGAELLRPRRRTARGARRWASLLQVLSIRLGGFDAGPLVDRLYAAAAMGVVRRGRSALAVARSWPMRQFSPSATRRQSPPGLPTLGELVAAAAACRLWLAAIAVVKVLHELGHALACRHFGARPQEMGVLLLAGRPALYCDVSDAWRLPSKWRRMAVSGAGMFVELLIAAVAVIVWCSRRARVG